MTELGLRTGMFPLYGKTIPHAGGWYGIGILTAGPYISVQKLMLPQASATEEPRALLLATIEAGGDTIVFASTHLSQERAEPSGCQPSSSPGKSEVCASPRSSAEISTPDRTLRKSRR